MSASRSHGERLKGTLSGCGSLSHTSQQSRYTSTMSNPLTDECGSMMSGYVPTTTPSTSYDPDPVEGSYDGRYVACSMQFIQPYSNQCSGGVAGVRVNPRGTSAFSSTEEDTEGEEREWLMMRGRGGGDARRGGGENMYNEYGESEALSDGMDISDVWDDASQGEVEEEEDEEQDEEEVLDDFDDVSEEDDDFMEIDDEACEDNDEEDEDDGTENTRAERWNLLDSTYQALHWRNLLTQRARSSNRCPSPPPSPRAMAPSSSHTCSTHWLSRHHLPTSYTPYDDDLHAPLKGVVDPTARAGKRGNGSKNRLLNASRRRGGGGGGACQTYADAASAAAMVPRHYIGYGREDDLCGGIRWIPFDDTDCFYYDHPRRSPLKPSAELLDEFGPPFDM